MEQWVVLFDDAFDREFRRLAEEAQDEIFALAKILQRYGPFLKRPHSDTLSGSRHANMKELRFSVAGGEWRVAYAFDPGRRAILLVAGDKSGVGQKQFYRELMRKADQRFDDHLRRLNRSRGGV